MSDTPLTDALDLIADLERQLAAVTKERDEARDRQCAEMRRTPTPLTDKLRIIDVTETWAGRYKDAIETCEHLERTLGSDYVHKSEVEGLRGALEKCLSALTEDALWCMDRKPPSSLEAEYADGTGSLTAGPNNCRAFFNARNEALTAARAALERKV